MANAGFPGCQRPVAATALQMVIWNGYIRIMDVSIAEAKTQLTKLIRAVEDGEQVVITRNGKAVAQIVPPPPTRRPVRFDTMRGKIHLPPGCLDPITEEQFFTGDY